MSAPPFITPLRQAIRQISSSSPRTRSLHHLPTRPRTKPTQCLRQPHRRPASFAANARSLFRQNPFSVPVATLAILIGAAGLIYAPWLYARYILGAFHNYPEEVAKKLRKALYYTNTDLQPQEAIKYYRQALQVAEEIGMDPFSDEIMGIKIQVAKLMEDLRLMSKAAQVLEILRRDSLEWLRQLGGKEHNKVKRTRVLAKVVAISVKLGELYGSPEIYDREMAEVRLVWAVETVLKERQRRDGVMSSEGITEEQLQEREGKWMSNSETGAAMEALAQTYEERDQHYLASPLFLQALSLYPMKDCHTVILMNNLASSLAQQSPRAAAEVAAHASSTTISSPGAPAAPAATRESLLQNAAIWAQKALDVAAIIKPSERTEECDVGCAVATHNLGEFAEMAGQKEVARRKYGEAVGIARAIGFQEGVENSSERLRALGG